MNDCETVRLGLLPRSSSSRDEPVCRMRASIPQQPCRSSVTMAKLFSFHVVVMRCQCKKDLPRTFCEYCPEDSRTGFVQLDRGMHKVIARTASGCSGCVHAPDGNGADRPREKLACSRILYIITAIGIPVRSSPNG